MQQTIEFDATAHPDTKMKSLCSFLEFWLGKRDAAFGVEQSELCRFELPSPLLTFHAFAGHWPRRVSIPEDPQWNHAFAWQDCLRPVEFLEYDGAGLVTFLHENQGVWELRTLVEGDDPPVWMFGDSAPEGRKIGDSLTDILITFVLQELLFGSIACVSDDELKDVNSLLTPPPSELWRWPVAEENSRMFAIRDTLMMGTLFGHRWLASNDQHYCEQLKSTTS